MDPRAVGAHVIYQRIDWHEAYGVVHEMGVAPPYGPGIDPTMHLRLQHARQIETAFTK
jgi:hypothetical protein